MNKSAQVLAGGAVSCLVVLCLAIFFLIRGCTRAVENVQIKPGGPGFVPEVSFDRSKPAYVPRDERPPTPPSAGELALQDIANVQFSVAEIRSATNASGASVVDVRVKAINLGQQPIHSIVIDLVMFGASGERLYPEQSRQTWKFDPPLEPAASAVDGFVIRADLRSQPMVAKVEVSALEVR